MMPDLGKYAETVLSSYAISIALMAALVIWSILRSRQVLRKLNKLENERSEKT